MTLLRMDPESTPDQVLVQFLGIEASHLLQALAHIDNELNAVFDTTFEPESMRNDKNVATYRVSVRDRQNTATLKMLNSKLDLLIQHAVYPTPRQSFDICLSADGCAFDLSADDLLQLGTTIDAVPTGVGVQEELCESRRCAFTTFAPATCGPALCATQSPTYHLSRPAKPRTTQPQQSARDL